MIITICSTKGGVGKTTLTASLGAILADFGRRVLLVDADPQPTLSSFFKLAHQAEYGLVEFLVQTESSGFISRTEIERLDLIYSPAEGHSGIMGGNRRRSFPNPRSPLQALDQRRMGIDFPFGGERTPRGNAIHRQGAGHCPVARRA